eukprot:955166-Prorocentrum_minimum.AAC.5
MGNFDVVPVGALAHFRRWRGNARVPVDAHPRFPSPVGVGARSAACVDRVACVGSTVTLVGGTLARVKVKDERGRLSIHSQRCLEGVGALTVTVCLTRLVLYFGKKACLSATDAKGQCRTIARPLLQQTAHSTCLTFVFRLPKTIQCQQTNVHKCS